MPAVEVVPIAPAGEVGLGKTPFLQLATTRTITTTPHLWTDTNGSEGRGGHGLLARLRAMTRGSGLALLAVAVMLIAPGSVHPCSCRRVEAIAKEIGKYPVIFLGEAIEVAEVSPDEQKTTFRVVRVWKGEKPSRSKITTSTYPMLCGYTFQKGLHYVVFASPRHQVLLTTYCSPTAPAITAAEIVRALDKRFGGKTEVSKDEGDLSPLRPAVLYPHSGGGPRRSPSWGQRRDSDARGFRGRPRPSTRRRSIDG